MSIDILAWMPYLSNMKRERVGEGIQNTSLAI